VSAAQEPAGCWCAAPCRGFRAWTCVVQWDFVWGGRVGWCRGEVVGSLGIWTVNFAASFLCLGWEMGSRAIACSGCCCSGLQLLPNLELRFSYFGYSYQIIHFWKKSIRISSL
jgi:hypothetical protein